MRYRPGLSARKPSVSDDDDTAVVGTINMDFRSFFLHFGCATCFYNSSVVAAVKAGHYGDHQCQPPD